MSCQLLICTRRSMYRIMLVLKRTSASDFFFFISRELFFITMLEEVRSRANGSGKINKLLQWIACECVHYHLDVTRTADSKKKKKISATSQRSERVRSRCANSRLSPNVPHHHGTKLRAQERWNVLRQLGGGLWKVGFSFFFFSSQNTAERVWPNTMG